MLSYNPQTRKQRNKLKLLDELTGKNMKINENNLRTVLNTSLSIAIKAIKQNETLIRAVKKQGLWRLTVVAGA